jgi:C4-dicarboxylate transporter/malic acid transport protein
MPQHIKPGIKPFSHLQHPREVIRQFTPNWFAATMGTGVLALALAQLPVAIPVCAVAEGCGCSTSVVHLVYLAYAARWVLFFDEARRIFGHSTVSMFFGTIPMGLATIINGFLVFGLPRWGEGVIQVAEVLWWLDVAMSLACGVLIPYMMFTRQEHSIDQMTAVWLLPVVAAEVAAASGGLLAPHLVDAHSQLVVLVTSYVLWAFSLPVAFSILTILLLRMALHKLPHENMAASSWLALGPIGTGALGMLLLGADAPAIFAANGLPGIGEIAAGLGLVAGITLWGFGLWWMLMAVLITAALSARRHPVQPRLVGLHLSVGRVFPGNAETGQHLHLAFFSVFGCVLVSLLAVMWLIVAKRTVQGAWRGELFVSPCIAGLKK